MYVMTATCGHSYARTTTNGRRRTLCDECKSERAVTRELLHELQAERARLAERARVERRQRAEQRALAREQAKLDAVAARERRKCRECGLPIPAARSLAAKYCGTACLRSANRRAHPADNPNLTCSADECVRPVRARSLCAMHYKRLRRAEGTTPPEPWSDRRRANYEKRRALKKGAPVAEPIDRDSIFERDHWTCGLCNGPVDASLKWPDPQSVSLDHIVPLSLGGAHSPENVQCAHLSCNVSKGNRVAA